MNSWTDSVAIYLDRRLIAILFLGFSSGLPLLLVFSTLSFWLKDEGVSLAAIGLFSLVRTPYTKTRGTRTGGSARLPRPRVARRCRPCRQQPCRHF